VKKIPTYFERDWNGDRSRVIDAVNPEAAWVCFGEGVATRKMDGACCMVRDGRLFKRRELRLTDAPPEGFERADYDPVTEKVVGWVPVGEGPEDKWFREAFAGRDYKDGTYELVGPKVNGNPEGWGAHELISHDQLACYAEDPPRTFEGLRAWMAGQDIEGIVWHHPDGRMAKLKLRDFGLKRSPA
jgi:hypothetical protein